MKLRNLFSTLTLTLATLFAAGAQAAEFKPGLIYDLGGRFDKSFNEAALNGAQDFEKDRGVRFRDFEITNDSQREQAMRNFARRGFNPIVTVGFSQATALEKVAKQFPGTWFGIIDGVVDLPNVQSVLFREEEGSFLVGMLAAMASESGTVGFVGGMDIPLIRRFACGYKQGVLHVDPGARVLENMTGTTGAAWNDPLKGGELAQSQFDRGADVVFHAAGATGLGVLQSAKDNGKLGIGVDSNQNHLHPGSVLTSMLKGVDRAVYRMYEQAQGGEWASGVTVLGIKEGGIDWALDEHNRALITAAMESAVTRARTGIINGDIAVHDYMKENTCPW
ncbi:MAG: BMP family ABC transporter substrate-binding protein [Gammaproteobacteria bacterium]|nr:BMP family ABC transporter substrate-binding protein [Gammaproteobacteria bacterium]